MKTYKFKKGDSVKVKDGVLDPDNGRYCIGGWQGRVADLRKDEYGEALLDIKWDSITLKNIPASFIYESEEEGLDYSIMALGEDDLVPAEVRDTERDVLDVLDEISERYPWSWLGEAGKQIDKILAGIDKDDADAILDAFKKHLEMTCVFPFDAEVSEYQEGGPLLVGDKISVKGISGADDIYGIIVETRFGRKKYHLPLLDLEVIDESSVNCQPVEDYKAWFANR